MKFFLSLYFTLGCWCFAIGQTIHTVDIEKEYQQGVEALNNYQYQKAVDHFYECHRVDTKNKSYLQKLAFCYMKLGDFREAKFNYHSLLKADSLNVNAWSNLGSIYEKELNYPKASECYQELLMIDSTNSYYFRQNATTALRMKNPFLALVHFSRAHELNKKDLVVINEMAGLLLQFEKPDEAEMILEGGLRFSPNNFKLLYTKADILHRKKDYEKIITTLSHAMSLGDTVTYYQKMIGAAYLHLEQFDSCLYHLEHVVNKRQDSELTHYQMALAYRGKGNLVDSEISYELAIGKAISENVGTYFKNLALVLDEQKKRKECLNIFYLGINGVVGRNVDNLKGGSNLYAFTKT